MRNIYNIRQIFVSFMATSILTWAFFNKNKIANIFKNIFRISFFIYIIGFLIYATYYAISNKSYLLLIIISIFIIGIINFFKKK